MQTKTYLIQTGLLTMGLLLTLAARAQTLGTTNLLEGPAGGSDSVVLKMTGAWSASTNVTWLHLSTANQSGTGSTNVVFSFDANTNATRTGTLTIAGLTLTVTQAGSTYVAASGVTTMVSSGLSLPYNGLPSGLAVDGAGNVYIADTYNNAIKKWTATNNTVSSLVSTGLNSPGGVAVDAANNVYIADTDNNIIKKWSAATSTVSNLVSSGLSYPYSVALDRAGNVYFADFGNSAIKKWTAPGGPVTGLVGLNWPRGVAVDGAGNLYIDYLYLSGYSHGMPVYYDTLAQWTAANSSVTTLVTLGMALSPCDGVAVDGGGNVYIANGGNNAIQEWTAASGSFTTLVSGLNAPSGVAVDGAGNIYFADSGNNAIKELPRAFVDPTARTETSAAGSDVLPVVVPATANLLAPFIPTSDQSWLAITGITNGVVSFSFTATATNRTGHILLLGVSVPIIQEPFSYSVNNGTVIITGYNDNGPVGNMVIPPTISGYPVTAIGEAAFQNCSGLTGVTIPNSVTSIGAWAFADSFSLTNVVIGSGVTNITDGAFIDCPVLINFAVDSANLNYTSAGGVLFNKSMTTLIQFPEARSKSYVLSNSVTMIGTGAFAGSGLTNVVIPNSVTNIGLWAFEDCLGLTNLTIPNGVISIDDQAFAGCTGLTNVTVPNSVITIGDSAFSDCSGVTSLTMGTNIASIGSSAFFGCSGVGSLTFGANFVNIGGSAFESCNQMTNVVIPNGNIGGSAFQYCYLLRSVAIGNGNIGSFAFSDCYGLQSVAIGNGVISIGSSAFQNCGPLLSVVIPDSVTSIGSAAFDGCLSLRSVSVGKNVTNLSLSMFPNCGDLAVIDVSSANPNYTSVGGVVFDKAVTTLLFSGNGFPGTDVFGDYTIPNGVTGIANNALNGCYVETITIPDSVTNIGNGAFGSCRDLHEAYFQGNAPSVNGVAGSADSTVFAGESGTAYYVPGTTGWGATFGGWPTALWYQPQPQILGSGPGFGVKSNRFNFTISWATNAAVVVQASTNLVNWSPVATNTLVNGTNAFVDLSWTNYPLRFYRVSSH